jgi:hypothetical protein
MTDTRTTGRIVGLLFLAALLFNGIGSEIAEGSTGRDAILAGELIEVLTGVAVIAVGAYTFGLFRRRHAGLAAGYLGFRITEAAVNAIVVVSTLTALKLRGPLHDAFLEQRYQAQLALIFVYAGSGTLWYWLLLRTRALPRFIPIWGLAGIAVLLAGAVADTFGHHSDMLVYGLPLGLNELFLGCWLLLRGFDRTVADQGEQLGGGQPAERGGIGGDPGGSLGRVQC